MARHLARRRGDHDLPAWPGNGGEPVNGGARWPRRSRMLDRYGWYEPRVAPMGTTTRQAEALNLALSSPPTTHRGLIVGIDRLSGQLVCHDPFIAYADRLVSSPNV